MSELLDAVIARVLRLPDAQRNQAIENALKLCGQFPWVPNPGPQTMAYHSKADELYYGGQAGGGKSDLGIGLGLTRHDQSLILRRYNDDAKMLAERTMQIVGSRDGYNGQSQILRLPNRLMEFGGCKDLEDRQRYKGGPKDLMVFDEIPDFLEQQYTFIIGWNRSANPNQRCRVVCCGNPPTTPEGLWVTKRWGAWLDPAHPRFGQVKEGDLLWYTTINKVDTEVDGPGPHTIPGEEKPVYAKSRTFIRARLTDNPELEASGYDRVLAGMPEELREAYRDGRFDASLKDRPFQLIPASWVRAANDRWTDRPPIGVPMCAMGIDCTGGSTDPMVIAARYDGYFDPMIVIPGAEIPQEMAGRAAAGYVFSYRRDKSIMIVDMGGGYGGPLYEHLHENFDAGRQHEPLVRAWKGSEASVQRTHDQTLGFVNKRTQALWRMREALDPGQLGGSPIMLPVDPELFADLTVCTYKMERGMIRAQSKEDVCAQLGRSTNKGDAVCMSWTAGPIASTDGAMWDEMRKEMGKGGRTGGRPSVIGGRGNARR